MKIMISGQDRTQDIGSRLQSAARERERGPWRPAVVTSALSSLRLSEASTEAQYHQLFLYLLRYRDNVDTLPFAIPHKPGLAGALTAKVKATLWKIFRYQHDRITFRQNLINHLYTSALEFQHHSQQREIQELRQRIAALESKSGQP